MQSVDVVYNSKAVRLSRRLLADIQAGIFKSGSLLPAEVALAERYHVSRPTVRRAVAILSARDELIKLPQRGVLVPSDHDNHESPGRDDQADPRPQPVIRPARPYEIAAVWAAEPDAHLIAIREGIKRYAAQAELEFKVFLSPEGHEEALRVLTHIHNYPIDGAIILPYAVDEYIATLGRLVGDGFPVVCVDRQVPDIDVNSVEVDNAAGVYQAMLHLIDKFHRPVHFFTCTLEHSTNLTRYAGFKRAMADAGFAHLVERNSCIFDQSDSDPDYWPADKKTVRSNAVAEQLLNDADLPISVMCLNDYVARSIYEIAHRRGLTIGRDIAVVGFDDSPMAKLLAPRLTTVRQPSERIGYEAARLLHRALTGKSSQPIHMHLPTELVTRESA